MDENQITKRVEGGRPQTGVTTHPVAPPIPAASQRRKWRWWMAVAILLVFGGAAVFFQFTSLFIEPIRNFAFQAACAATVFLLAVWYVFFTGLPWRTKCLLGGVGFLALAVVLAVVRVRGSYGDMSFQFVFVWDAPPDAGLPRLSGDPLQTGRDATVRPGDFPQFLGPERNATVPGVFLEADWAAHPPRQVWQREGRDGLGAGWSSFAVAGDLAVTQEQRGNEELVVARDRGTGEVVWAHGNTVRFSQWQGGDGPRATPTIAGGKVFAHGATGILDCLDASTGKLIWSRDTLQESAESNLNWGVSASPLVVEPLGLVVISLGSGGAGGTLAAYDVAGGGRKWVGGSDAASYSSPMLATLCGRQLIVSVNDKTVTGHDPADGKVLWEYRWRPSPAKASQPVVLPGDRLLVTTDYNVPAVLLQLKRDGDRWTPQEVWTANHLATNFSTAVVRDHYAYGLNDGALACIDLDNDGEQVWQAPRSDRFGYGQVLLVGDLLIVQAEGGDVALVKADPSGFHKLGVLHAFTSKTWNNPALAGNRLFLRNDREAACYELATVEKR